MATLPTLRLKPATLSKINWTQVVAVVAMITTMFGFDIAAEQQAEIVAGILAIQAAVTVIIKTFFTTSITPAAAERAGLL